MRGQEGRGGRKDKEGKERATIFNLRQFQQEAQGQRSYQGKDQEVRRRII